MLFLSYFYSPTILINLAYRIRDLEGRPRRKRNVTQVEFNVRLSAVLWKSSRSPLGTFSFFREDNGKPYRELVPQSNGSYEEAARLEVANGIRRE